jgi:glycosyltransferase 2 family protein
VSKLIRIGVSAILLTWIGWQTDWPRVGEAFANLRVELWLAAVGVLVASQVVSAMRWRVMARALGFERSVTQLTGFYFIGMYFNLLLPTSVGGDVVRAWYLDGGSKRRLGAFAAVFLDRLSGLVVLLALACLSVALSPLTLEPWISWGVWGTCASIVLGVAALPFLARRMRNGKLRAQQVKTVLATLSQPRIFAATTALSIFVQVANVVLVWLVGLALHAEVPPSFYWVFVPMVSLLTLLPISVNGMGVREGGTALLLAPFGVSHDTAVTLAFLWFAVYAATSLLGGLVYLFGRFPKPASSSDEEAGASDGSVDRDSDQGREGQSRAAA